MSGAEAFGRYGRLSRRGLLRAGGVGLTGAGAALLFGCGDDGPKPLPNEPLPPPEVRRIRLPAWEEGAFASGQIPCVIPLSAAEEFLREEGIEPEYVNGHGLDPWAERVADGTFDFTQDFAAATILGLERVPNLTILAGVHIGCYELFAHDGIRTFADLRGKRVAVPFGGDAKQPDYAFMVTVMNYIGVPADRIVGSYNREDLPSLLQSRQVDAVLALQPTGENLRNLEGVRVILNSEVDPPFSSHYCCVFFANRRFVKKNPIATKRVLRALLKGTDLVAQDPEAATRLLMTLDSTIDYGTLLKMLSHLPYNVWANRSPEDSLRFYALRLRDAGELKSTPDKVLESADWRFLEQLKRELAYAPGPAFEPSAYKLNCEIESSFGPSAAAPRSDDGRATGTT